MSFSSEQVLTLKALVDLWGVGDFWWLESLRSTTSFPWLGDRRWISIWPWRAMLRSSPLGLTSSMAGGGTVASSTGGPVPGA